jgi:hypothetical protein
MNSTRPILLLHVGGAKAGSSAIQTMLRDNANILRDSGWVVASADLMPSGRLTGDQVQFFEGLLPIDDDAEGLVRARLREIHNDIVRNRRRGLIISAENLINSADFARLFVRSVDIFDIHVVVYVRRQDDYAIAAWNQWYFKENDDFLSWSNSVKGSLGNWDISIQRWERQFPDVTYDVHVFQRNRLVDGNVVTDFLKIVGVSPEIVRLPSDRINATLNEVAMRVAQRNRELYDGLHDSRFSEFIRDLGGKAATERVQTGLYFDGDARVEFLAAYDDANERLRARHFPDLPVGGLFELSAPDGDVLDGEPVIQRELDLLWRVAFKLYLASKARR